MSDKTSYRKGNGFLAILASLWGMVKFALIVVIIAIALVEVFTPSLNYTTAAPKPYRSAQPPGWMDASDLQPERSYRTVITTSDYRQLQVDYFAPPNLMDSPVPLTVIVAGFATPEWLLSKVRPRGHNAVVIYRSPRLARMTGDMIPSTAQVRYARSAGDYWNILATNPFNYAYNIHAGFHEAPGDIVDIVKWAVDNIHADLSRINIVGMGTGALVAAAATEGLQVSGAPARTLTLIYPPADLASTIRDNLTAWPAWSRRALAMGLEQVYFRLRLERHLPNIYSASKLIVIPENSFEIATYAAEPAIALAGNKTTVERVNMNYGGYYEDTRVNTVREIVGRWLVSQGGITSY